MSEQTTHTRASTHNARINSIDHTTSVKETLQQPGSQGDQAPLCLLLRGTPIPLLLGLESATSRALMQHLGAIDAGHFPVIPLIKAVTGMPAYVQCG